MTFDEGTYEKWKAAIGVASTSPRPINFSQEATGQDVMVQFPAEEGECIRQDLGDAAYGQFLRSNFSSGSSQIEDEVLSRCLSNESISRFFIGFAVSGLGELSDATIACMGVALSRQDLQVIFSSSETAWGEAFQAMARCLNDQERARAEATGFFGDVEEETEVERRVGKPGLIDVGGRQLYLICEGEGSPTVVMESGGGTSPSGGVQSWRIVQPLVAGFTRVCSYDRAGVGWSDPTSDPLDFQGMVDDLHTLLANAGIGGPYVLVGHSFGGYLVRLFTSKYPDNVAGMILVDPGHEEFSTRAQAAVTAEEWQLYIELFRQGRAEGPEERLVQAGLPATPPDDIPFMLLSGRFKRPQLSPELNDRLLGVMVALHRELVSLSSSGTHIDVPDSGHAIQNDRPDVVVDAIRKVVEKVGGREAPSQLSPIVVAEGTARQDVMGQLPGGEVEYIRQSLGEAAFSQFSRSDNSQDTSETEEEALARCLSSESISRIFIGFAVSVLGGLSDATITCMGDAFAGLDLRAIFFGEGKWEEAIQAMAGCLNDDERALADARGLFEPSSDEAPTGTPGLVDVGEYQLYLTCKGEGNPTVVMEAGGRGNSGSWHLVQPEAARFTRVCAYDRAGTGRSESVPPHSTAQAIADDLHDLLENAGFDGPYVLVGHSLGGHLMRIFASRYLNDVVGMVLVDTGHGDPRRRFQEVLTPEEWQRLRGDRGDEDFTLPEGLDLLGPDLGDTPLVVLSAGAREAVPVDIAERHNQVLLDMIGELMGLSTNSTHIIAEESGHAIQRDQPDLVIDAIRQVVEAVRNQGESG